MCGTCIIVRRITYIVCFNVTGVLWRLTLYALYVNLSTTIQFSFSIDLDFADPDMRLKIKYDMCWQKRGSERSYSSPSGVDAIKGQLILIQNSQWNNGMCWQNRRSERYSYNTVKFGYNEYQGTTKISSL